MKCDARFLRSWNSVNYMIQQLLHNILSHCAYQCTNDSVLLCWRILSKTKTLSMYRKYFKYVLLYAPYRSLERDGRILNILAIKRVLHSGCVMIWCFIFIVYTKVSDNNTLDHLFSVQLKCWQNLWKWSFRWALDSRIHKQIFGNIIIFSANAWLLLLEYLCARGNHMPCNLPSLAM